MYDLKVFEFTSYLYANARNSAIVYKQYVNTKESALCEYIYWQVDCALDALKLLDYRFDDNDFEFFHSWL